jgi:hypothetical protein
MSPALYKNALLCSKAWPNSIGMTERISRIKAFMNASELVPCQLTPAHQKIYDLGGYYGDHSSEWCTFDGVPFLISVKFGNPIEIFKTFAGPSESGPDALIVPPPHRFYGSNSLMLLRALPEYEGACELVINRLYPPR